MKKLLVPLAAMLLLALAIPAVAEVELGISATPVAGGQSNVNGTDFITGFHVAYAWSILYFTWDSLAMPASTVESMTSSYDPIQQKNIPGTYAPGFLNLFDGGLRLTLQPFVVSATVGTNRLHVYNNLPGGGEFGANLRLGAGLRFNSWGLSLSGTAAFSSFTQLGNTVKGLFAKDTKIQDAAVQAITDRLIPSIGLTFYF
jgi:hypothetical protein